ncbi:MAG: LytTR family DNA-binding domain-containing protein [Bacteroidota bacterium]
MIPENFYINAESFSIPRQSGFKTILIKNVVSFVSEKSGTFINCIDSYDSTLCEIPLAVFAEAFAPQGFFRIHNNCVVNTLHVKDFDRSLGNRVLMCNKICHYASRNNCRDFEEAMLKPYRNLMKKNTIRSAKPTGYVTNYTICGILSNQLWLALYIWQVIYDTTPIESYIL